jgi:hypothetical protein
MLHSPTPWKLNQFGAIICKSHEVAYVSDDSHNGQTEKADREHIVKCVNLYDELVSGIKCSLADLEGIMPEYEPSGDRTHPAWKTITELKHLLSKSEQSSI